MPFFKSKKTYRFANAIEMVKITIQCGEVTEWSNVPDSKSGVPQGTAGSNPALSAIFLEGQILIIDCRMN